MSLVRKDWKSSFTLTSKLNWPCPFCFAKSLRIKTDSLMEGETAPSKAARNGGDWEPQWLQGRFSCILECRSCEGELAMCGEWHPEEEEAFDEQTGPYLDWTNQYAPGFFTDAPPLIAVPDAVPFEVASEINRSFGLFWNDIPACANAIRAALEALMTVQKINKSTGRPKPGKSWVLLTLHKRIELFGQRQQDLSKKLLAVKLIGNVGSHRGALNRDDIFDAYEILGFVLDELYLNRAKKIGALAKQINRKNAPRSARRNRRR